MKYKNIKQGKFISRPNRFIANVEIDGKVEVCHVKNTGRCSELLVPGARVYVQQFNNPERKTKYDLIAVLKGNQLVNMDSQAPNKVFGEWINKYFKNISLVKPEAKYKNSRFDFYIEADDKKIFVEVKGVTLENDGVVKFPDGPTMRGIKHLNELCECIKDGYKAYLFFVIQMENAKLFMPNRDTHPKFADALLKAKECGVKVCAVNCRVKPDLLEIKEFVEVRIG